MYTLKPEPSSLSPLQWMVLWTHIDELVKKALLRLLINSYDEDELCEALHGEAVEILKKGFEYSPKPEKWWEKSP